MSDASRSRKRQQTLLPLILEMTIFREHKEDGRDIYFTGQPENTDWRSSMYYFRRGKKAKGKSLTESMRRYLKSGNSLSHFSQRYMPFCWSTTFLLQSLLGQAWYKQFSFRM